MRLSDYLLQKCKMQMCKNANMNPLTCMFRGVSINPQGENEYSDIQRGVVDNLIMEVDDDI